MSKNNTSMPKLLNDDASRYEDRLILYVDILGWRSAIQRSVNNRKNILKLGHATDINYGIFERSKPARDSDSKQSTQSDVQVIQFSDTIVVSMHYGAFAARYFLGYLTVLIVGMIDLGLLVRGAITYGKLIHRGSTIFGPALIRAYDLERTISIYPRIILDPGLEKALIKDLEVVKSTDGLSLWRTDFDGMQFFNFLGVGPQYVVKTSLHDPKLATFALKSTFAYLKKNRAMVKQSPQLYSKFSWLAKYYNLVCAEFPMFQMDSFTFE